MTEFEQTIEKAVQDRDIPGCVLQAVNRDGSFKYVKTFGTRSIKENGDRSPLRLDTVMWIASCTKLMTAVCATQLVERGQLSLDDPVYSILPELKEFKVLEGFDDNDKPILKPHTNPVTLRLLLTHSSGLTYAQMHPSIMKYYEVRGEKSPQSATILERFSCPLIYEPGTSWSYGPGIDYAGLMVERVSKLTLEQYMQKNLWNPLGIKDMTFFLSTRPDMKARLADMSLREEENGKVRHTDGKQAYMTADGGEVTDCMGGQGVFATAEEYIKVLHAVLTTDQDEKILKKSSVEELSKPSLTKAAAEALNKFLFRVDVNNAMGGAPQNVRKDYALGGLLVLDDGPVQKAGTMIWGGLPNLSWFVDRKAGLAGLYAGQVIPPGDSKCAALVRAFEKEVYDLYSKEQKA